MIVLEMNTVIIYLSCLILILIIGKIFIIPIKKILKLIMNSVFGGIIIYIINLIGANFNFHIGLNVWTALIVGLLGIPGVVLLILIQLVIS